MLQSIRRRWLAVVAIMLLCLAAGAGWAALVTPSYRATALLDDPDLLVTGELFQGDGQPAAVQQRLLAASQTADIELDRSGSALVINVDADSGGVAVDAAQLYVDTALDSSRTVRLMNAPEFPVSPRTPNVRRTALTAGVIGLVLGLGQALLVDRLLRPPTGEPKLDLTYVQLSEDDPSESGLASLLVSSSSLGSNEALPLVVIEKPKPPTTSRLDIPEMNRPSVFPDAGHYLTVEESTADTDFSELPRPEQANAPHGAPRANLPALPPTKIRRQPNVTPRIVKPPK